MSKLPKVGKAFRALPDKDRIPAIQQRRWVGGTVGALAIVVGLGVGLVETDSGPNTSVSPNSSVSAELSPKPNAIARLIFRAGGTNWQAAEALSALEGEPANLKSNLHALEEIEQTEYSYIPKTEVQIGEVVDIPVHVTDPYTNPSDKNNGTVEIELIPTESQ